MTFSPSEPPYSRPNALVKPFACPVCCLFLSLANLNCLWALYSSLFLIATHNELIFKICLIYITSLYCIFWRTIWLPIKSRYLYFLFTNTIPWNSSQMKYIFLKSYMIFIMALTGYLKIKHPQIPRCVIGRSDEVNKIWMMEYYVAIKI